MANVSAATAFTIVDFGGIGELDGDAKAVGTTRTIPAGPAEIVEEMVAREVTPTKMSYSYVIVNEDTNPFQVSRVPWPSRGGSSAMMVAAGAFIICLSGKICCRAARRPPRPAC